MPFKLTKPQTTEYNLLAENARQALETLNQAIADYNEAHEAQTATAAAVTGPHADSPPDRAEVEQAYSAYRSRVDEMNTFAQRLGEEWRDEIDEKSDSWQDSDRGQAADDFTSEWENFEADPDSIDWDENPLSDYDGSEIDDFEALPEEYSP